MSEKITIALLGAGLRGAVAYGSFIQRYPDLAKYVAFAEPNMERHERFRKTFKIPDENCFHSWEELLARPKLADAIIISTQDHMHFDAAKAALEKGYHILMEKPVSTSPLECVELSELAKKTNRVFLVCYVLRYSAFYRKLKEIVVSGDLGDLVSISHNENIAYWHFAHSFVRGNWCNTKASSPLILTKSSHDMDLLLWLAGADCKRISSFGSLSHFRPENAPAGAPERCVQGCPAGDTCLYNAKTFYEKGQYNWTVHAMTSGVPHSKPGPDGQKGESRVQRALKEGPYGRCVYRCDNDVVDHQAVTIEFENGVTAAFNLCAFTPHMTRTIKLLFTKAEVRAEDMYSTIEINRFGVSASEVIRIEQADSGHGGGDFGVMNDFLSAIDGRKLSEITDIHTALQSHLMAFAAEESRVKGCVTDYTEYAHGIMEQEIEVKG